MNEAGNLVVGNLGLNGQDRVCTELPDVNGVQVQLARPSFALPEKGDQVLLTSRRCMYPICGGVWLVDLHRKPNGTMEGFMDYTDDACMNEVVSTKNGEEMMRPETPMESSNNNLNT